MRAALGVLPTLRPASPNASYGRSLSLRPNAPPICDSFEGGRPRPPLRPTATLVVGPELPGPNPPEVDTLHPGVAQFIARHGIGGGLSLASLGPARRDKDTSTIVLFELDNFGDIGATPLFPAPLSPAALAILPLGGLVCLWFGVRPAARDVLEGVRNLRALQAERQRLRVRMQELVQALAERSVDAGEALALRRELTALTMRAALCRADRRTERIDRVISGALIAPAALMTTVGTLLSPGFITASHSSSAALAANLLTGFVGNGPLAIYALVNTAFNLHRVQRAQQRLNALRGFDFDKTWRDRVSVNELLRARQRLIRNNCAVKAASSLGIGVGSILTAINPIGYAVLLPFAVGRACAEYVAHTKIGYTRRLYNNETEDLSRRDLSNELIYAYKTHAWLKELKTNVRGRMPWGVEAPLPISLVPRLRHLLVRGRQPAEPSALQQVHSAITGYRSIERQWIVRKELTLCRDRLRLWRATEDHCDNGAVPHRLHRIDATINSLRRRVQWIDQDRRAIGLQPVDIMQAAAAYAWIERTINFFVDTGLFAYLAAYLYRDKKLRATLREALQEGAGWRKRALRVDATIYLRQLRADPEILLSAEFLRLFYASAERALLIEVKNHYQELSRELMDMLTTRTFLKAQTAK